MFFKPKAVKELDSIIKDIKINLSNNYKEPAHAARKKLNDKIEEFHNDGSLTEKDYMKYKAIAGEYNEIMKDYHH